MVTDPHLIIQILKSPENEALLLQPYGYRQINRALLQLCADAVHEIELAFPWNDYNRQAYARHFLEGESIMKTPDLPKYPRPYRSWAEFSSSEFGGMQGFAYEPKGLEVYFYVKHKHVPDWVDPLNNRVWYQGKGVISNLESARSYIASAKQNCITHVFIFTVPNIQCPWLIRKPRKDGSVMTLEEWCDKEGFDYCYKGQEGEWIKSERRAWLVENTGINLPQLGNHKQTEYIDKLIVDAALFAHKQQVAHGTMTVQ